MQFRVFLFLLEEWCDLFCLFYVPYYSLPKELGHVLLALDV